MKNIVVAVEFDEELEDIVEFTCDLLKGKETKVHVVHVYQPDCNPAEYEAFLVDGVSSYEDHLQEQAKSVRAIVGKMIEREVKASGYMKPIDKNVAESIIEFCGEKGAELLVVGTHHPNRVERVILGSVTEMVLRRADLPVAVVPRKS